MSEESLRWCWPMYPLRPKPINLGEYSRGIRRHQLPENRQVLIDAKPGTAVDLTIPVKRWTKFKDWRGYEHEEEVDATETVSFYVPDRSDLLLAAELFSDGDAGNPPWLKIEAELVAGGVPSTELRKDSALTLLNRLKATRKQPEPQPTVNTFGQLLKDRQDVEATRSLANRTGAKATGQAIVGSPSAHYILTAAQYHAEANTTYEAMMARPGASRIQAICEAETGRFDSETMKMVRGRLCVSLNAEPSITDAMGLAEFADAWRSYHSGNDKLANRGVEIKADDAPTDISTIQSGVSLQDVTPSGPATTPNVDQSSITTPVGKPNHPDGPEDPHWLWLNNVRHKIGTSRAKQSYDLLKYFWNCESETFQGLIGKGKPWDDPVFDNTYSVAATRFNNDMPKGFPWKLKTDGRCMFKELS